MNFYDLPEKLDEELAGFEKAIKNFQNKSLNPVEFKAIRVPFGVYEQRKHGTFMVRIRCVGGGITPTQLQTVAKTAKKFSSGVIHLTTRAELQIHDVSLGNIIPIIREIKKVELSTRGGGGNTVRNILTSVDSGVAKEEIFDVLPYASALTSQLISEDDSWSLPRKYKISFSGTAIDSANATVQDLGFIAKIVAGKKGFSVYVAGGLGARPLVGNLLYDFVPTAEIYPIARGLKNMFDKYGNRKNKHAARLRFLWQKLERTEFVRILEQEIAAVKQTATVKLKIKEIENKPTLPNLEPLIINSNNFTTWKNRYVTEQKQIGLYTIDLPLEKGFLSSDEAAQLAGFLKNFGDNVLRCNLNQNFQIRNIDGKFLGNIYQEIASFFPLSHQPRILSTMVTCAGASTCQLGICLSRGALDAVTTALKQSSLDLDKLSNIKIHISGCPNSCGQHWLADLGFYGGVLKKGTDSYPAYHIVAGANLKETTSLAKKLGSVAAHDLPTLLVDILTDYTEKKSQFDSFSAYINERGKVIIDFLSLKLKKQVPSFQENQDYYYDFTANEIFSTTQMGQGECSAGIFDMIDVDAAKIKESKKLVLSAAAETKKDNLLYDIILFSSHMLLVTKGLSANSDTEIFDNFISGFLEENLIDNKFKKLILSAKEKNFKQLIKFQDQIFELAEAVEKLYESMDESLRFKAKQINTQPTQKQETKEIDLFKDFRGIGCPLNFVKTKLVLEMMDSGKKLKIYLDDGAPIQNVPKSVKTEGHSIVSETKIDNYWEVVIQKA